MRHVDRGGALVGVGVRQQTVERHVAEARIGAVALAIQEGALLRLHQDMDAPHRIECGEIEAFGDLQHLQHGEAGGVRRRLRDTEAAIRDADRVLQFRPAFRQIAFVDQNAGLAHAGGETLRKPAAVEAFRAVLRDLLQRAREVGLADQRGERRHADIEPCQEHRARPRIGGEHRDARRRRNGGSGG